MKFIIAVFSYSFIMLFALFWVMIGVAMSYNLYKWVISFWS